MELFFFDLTINHIVDLQTYIVVHRVTILRCTLKNFLKGRSHGKYSYCTKKCKYIYEYIYIIYINYIIYVNIYIYQGLAGRCYASVSLHWFFHQGVVVICPGFVLVTLPFLLNGFS